MHVENAGIYKETAGKIDIKPADVDHRIVMMMKMIIVQEKVHVRFQVTVGVVIVRGRKGESIDIKEIGEDIVIERNHQGSMVDVHVVNHSHRVIVQEAGVEVVVEAEAEVEVGHRRSQVRNQIKAEVIVIVVEVEVIIVPNKRSHNKVCVKIQEVVVIIIIQVIIII
jgi:uncharacterized protein YuzE